MPKIAISGRYDENNISGLIRKLNIIFDLKNKQIPNYEFQVTTTAEEFTSIHSLVLYKIIAFAVDEYCFQFPTANLNQLTTLFAEYHLHDLIKAYITKEDIERIYANVQPVIKNDFFIAPHPISRTEFKDKAEIESKYYNTIVEYYKDFDYDIVDCIKTCLVEISSNFYYHATDNKSILMAEGTKKKIEICSVDTSEGIIGTMKKRYTNKKDIDLLKMAFQRRVSSKLDKGHCGTGLWLVNELVTKLKGKLILHTGGYLYRNINGKISTFESSYWQGTVLYVKLPIVNDMGIILKQLLVNEKSYI